MNLARKESIYQLAEYIIAIVLVLECRSFFNNMPATRNQFWLLMLGLLSFAVFLCVVTKRKIPKKRAKRTFTCLAVLFVYFVGYALLNGYNLSGFLWYLISVAVLLVYYCLCCKEQAIPTVLLKYDDVICVIAAVSVLLWLLGSVMGVIAPTGAVIMNWEGTGEDTSYSSYYNLLLEVQSVPSSFTSRVLYKNTAIFVEAPMYSLHLSLALMIELFVKMNTSKKRCILLVGTIITTFSTSGYLLALFALSLHFFLSSKKKIRQILLILSPLLIITVALVAYQLLFLKLTDLSGLTRIDDFITGWNVFKSNVLCGIGYDNYEMLQTYMSLWRSNSTGMSSSLMLVISYGGMYFIVPFAICFYRGLKSDANTRIFTLLLVMLWIITVFPFQYILTLLCLFILDKSIKYKNGTSHYLR